MSNHNNALSLLVLRICLLPLVPRSGQPLGCDCLTKEDLTEMASKLNMNETTSVMIINKHLLDAGFMNEKAISF